MTFKHILIAIFVCFSVTTFSFPKLSQENIAIQTKLVEQINASPNNVDLRFELAMEFAATGWIELGWDQLSLIPKLHDDYKSVVFKKYQQKLKEDPDNWKYHFRLAFAYYFLKEKENAVESFKTVLKYYPKHVWSMGLIALLYGEKKDYKQAIKWCKKALKINDDATAIHFLLGKAYYETGNVFGVLGESLSVGRLKSIENKYKPSIPIGIIE